MGLGFEVSWFRGFDCELGGRPGWESGVWESENLGFRLGVTSSHWHMPAVPGLDSSTSYRSDRWDSGGSGSCGFGILPPRRGAVN